MKNIDKEELHDIFNEIPDKSEEIYNKFYSKYNRLVYAIAFSILKNKENSEDVMQNVFLKIWNLEKEKLPTTNEASWLYTTTKNEAINFLRKQSKEVNIDDLYYISSENEELDEIIEKTQYNNIISKLNPKEQEIVSLKILSGLSFKEIAKMLNMPIGTVQWRYYKALHTLKILLSNLAMFIVTFNLLIAKKYKNRAKQQIVQDAIMESETDNQNATQSTNETAKGNTIDNSISNSINNALDATFENKVNDKTEVEKNGITNTESAEGDATFENKIINIIANDENDENENSQFTNEETENIQTPEVIVSNNDEYIDCIDIGLISISAIFLVITLTCLINLIKNRKK